MLGPEDQRTKNLEIGLFGEARMTELLNEGPAKQFIKKPKHIFMQEQLDRK